MAQKADIELSVGAIVDVASINKAGQQMRAILQKELGGAISGGLPSVFGDYTKGYMEELGKSRGGLETYRAIGGLRRGLRGAVAAHSVLGAPLTQEQRETLAMADETLRVYENVTRRTAINEPINRELSRRRLGTKVDEALKSMGQNLPSDFAERYIAARDSGNTAELAKLDKQYRTKAIAARTIMANPELVTDKQYERASSILAVRDTIKEKDAQNKRDLRDNTKALKTLTVVASGVVATGLRTMAQVLPTYWHENVTRSTFGRMEAEVARAKAVGSGGGGIAGSIIGGVLGAMVGGTAGAMIGTGVGSQIGGTIGGLWGQYGEERLESTKRSIKQVQERYRARGIYGGQYGVGYANTVAETGMATAGDVEKMTHNSATLAARMMFGQVGENEMLMYSLMPGYFAAAMSGASSEQLAEAFAADLNRLPPQLRTWVAEGVGGGSLGMMAYVNSPNFGYIQSHASELRGLDAAQILAGAGFQTQGGVRGVIDRRAENAALYADVEYGIKHQRPGIFMPANYGAEQALDITTYNANPTFLQRLYSQAEKMITSGDAEKSHMGLELLNKATSRVIHQTINLNVDGNTIQSVDHEMTPEELAGGHSLTYTLGI